MSQGFSASASYEVQMEIEENKMMDFTNLEDVLKVTCSFEKLQLILKMLLNSQKNHSAHIKKLFELQKNFEDK